MSKDVRITESRTRGPVDEAEGQAATIAEAIYRERVKKITDDVVVAGGAGSVAKPRAGRAAGARLPERCPDGGRDAGASHQGSDQRLAAPARA